MLTEIERTFPKITEDGLDALRQRIGVKIGVTVEPWCYEATRDNIRHYAHGIGDDNPLWCVPEYAAKTKYGDVIFVDEAVEYIGNHAGWPATAKQRDDRAQRAVAVTTR